MKQGLRKHLFCCAAAALVAGAGATSAAPTTDVSFSQFCAYGDKNCQGAGSAGPLAGQFPGSFASAQSGGTGGGGGAGGGGGGGSTGSPARQSAPGSDQADVVEPLIDGLLSDQPWRGRSFRNRRGMGNTVSGTASSGSSTGSSVSGGGTGSSGGGTGSSGGGSGAGSSASGLYSAGAQGDLGVDMVLAGQQYDAVLDSAMRILREGPDLGDLGLPGSPGDDGGVAASAVPFGGGDDGLNTPVAAPIPATLALIAIGLLGLRLARQR